MVQTDFLVIGSGMAGLVFALKASSYGDVLLITKKEDTESNTNYAQGGIASVFDPKDSIERHVEDTLKVGAGLCNRAAVEMMAREGPGLVEDLRKMGVGFSLVETDGAIRYDLGMEGGHSRRRIVHAKDFTGREIERTLVDRVRSAERVTLLENSLAFSLITAENACFGAWILRSGRIEKVFSKITFIAAGGCGRVYHHTTNPRIATGGGIAMGFRAGAEMRNMEFIQFHPTSVYGREIDGRKLLVSETVRGEGGVLRTKNGDVFMERYDPRGCLAPRDVVARAIDSELRKSGDEFVWLDLSPIGASRVTDRFPQIHSDCLSVGIDITKQPIPVVPAAHYVCGGITVDLRGRTSVDRLYAAGEAACTGVHGANRLASNSLLEALVFSEMSARDAAGRVGEALAFPEVEEARRQEETLGRETVARLRLEIRRLMWECVGIVRSDGLLAKARKSLTVLVEQIEDLYSRHRVTVDSVELRNMATVAALITRCSLIRRESRGLHYNRDHPDRDDLHYGSDTVVKGP